MAVMAVMSDDCGKPAPTMFSLYVSPEPGGAVPGTVLLLAERCPEPTQRGCSGGQVCEIEALILYEGLGGETVAK